MSATLNYMKKRRRELNSQIDPQYSDRFFACWDLIDKEMTENFHEVTPVFVRKVELLEGFLMAFFQHLFDQELLSKFEKEVGLMDVKESVGRFFN